VRILLVAGVVEASAGELLTQAAPASDKDTPITPRAFLPRPLFCGLSDERAIRPLLISLKKPYRGLNNSAQRAGVNTLLRARRAHVP
jgi:hypothetical protein